MKKLMLLSTLLLIISVAVFVVYAYNRDTSIAAYEVNTTYGLKYDPPVDDLLSLDRTGTDGDGPLYTTAHTWEGFTDDGNDGENWLGPVSEVDDENAPRPPMSDADRAFIGVGVLDSEIDWRVKQESDFGWYGYWVWPADYIKKFLVSSWAYVSCGESYKKYRTTYALIVSVPEGFHIPRKQKLGDIEYGSFSKSLYMYGDKDGWDFELEDGTTEEAVTTAYAKADGYHPSKDESHASKAEAPGPADARDLYYDCSSCGSTKKSDIGCSFCANYISSRPEE